MFRLINRTSVAFMGVFVAACLAAFVYQYFFVWPEQQCDQVGAWWDAKDHQCLSPMPIWRITGRMAPRTVIPATPPAAKAGPATPAKR